VPQGFRRLYRDEEIAGQISHPAGTQPALCLMRNSAGLFGTTNAAQNEETTLRAFVCCTRSTPVHRSVPRRIKLATVK